MHAVILQSKLNLQFLLAQYTCTAVIVCTLLHVTHCQVVVQHLGLYMFLFVAAALILVEVEQQLQC